MLSSRRKQLPEITWKNIAPPYKEYAYFEGCKDYPFRYNATVFDMVNAWWLIEAATLVYAEEAFVRQEFGKAGLGNLTWFSGPSTQCAVVSNARFAILAFRGTESRRREGRSDFRDIVADVKADADARLVDSKQGGKVHEGFKNALDEVWDKVLPELRGALRGNRRVWITGHSLGAALATLAADRFGDVQGLYTFGSPRVGDASFKDDFHVRCYRVVNGDDIVTKVPPAVSYTHVGELKYIDGDGVMHDSPRRWERLADEIHSGMAAIFNALGEVREGFSSVIPEGIKNHVPTLYATHIWNNIPEPVAAPAAEPDPVLLGVSAPRSAQPGDRSRRGLPRTSRRPKRRSPGNSKSLDADAPRRISGWRRAAGASGLLSRCG